MLAAALRGRSALRYASNSGAGKTHIRTVEPPAFENLCRCPLTRSIPASAMPMSDNAFYRFLGGHPIKVLIRLALLSLIVGALMLWLDIRPLQIIEAAQRFAKRISEMGFDAVREAGQYIVAGAIVVVPIWFILRLLGSRSHT